MRVFHFISGSVSIHHESFGPDGGLRDPAPVLPRQAHPDENAGQQHDSGRRAEESSGKRTGHLKKRSAVAVTLTWIDKSVNITDYAGYDGEFL